MTQELKRAYIARVHLRYQKASRKEKALILDEFCEVFKVTRKHAIKLVNELPVPAGTRPGPKVIYGSGSVASPSRFVGPDESDVQ